MDWTKQAETMMKTWGEAQKQAWGNWYDLMRGASNSNGSPFGFYPDIMKQWQEMSLQTINSWTAGSDPIAQNAARQLMASQESMMRFMQSITQAWQAIAPKVQAGEDWQSVLRDYSNQYFQGMMGTPTGFMSAGKDINELFKFYMQEWQKMGQPWMQSFLQSPTNISHILMGGSSELAQLSKFHWDVYERTFGGMTEVPGMGYNRELNAKLLRGFDSWVEMQKVSAEYHTVLTRTFSNAFESFMGKLVTLSEKGEVIDSIQDLANMYFDTIDETFTKLYVSQDYLDLQNNLAKAGMTNKMRQQEIFEVFQEMLDMPTRSELDDAYRTLNDLRREVKALKRALKAQDQPKAVAASKSTRSTSTRRKTTAKKSNGKTPEETAAEAAKS
ncbi:MAG: hypothetical protein KDJ52_09140 [Anaerolineae bacterium]|nr:hypothetical protein [Anaerolineae bacterium]